MRPALPTHRIPRALGACAALLPLLAAAPVARAQSDHAVAPASRLALGFAVDTTVTPATHWGVDPALAARAGVVRFWRDYLAVRADRARRAPFWSAADRRRLADPDLASSADYILGANAVLVEALPLAPGDSSRWLLRTVYVGGGTAARPGLLAMERVHVVREGGRWALAHPGAAETADWRRARVGRLEFVVHPGLRFDPARAAQTARWVDSTARRFGIADPAPITYYQLPDLETAGRVTGLDWTIAGERVGGRANPRARIVLAADPRYAEAYRHEIAHVLLAPWLDGAPAIASEGIAYWLGGARGLPFPLLMRDLAEFVRARPSLGLGAILDGEQAGAESARFPAAAAVFELAHRRGGDGAVRRLVAASRTAAPTTASIAAALGMDAPALERAWRATVESYAAAATR